MPQKYPRVLVTVLPVIHICKQCITPFVREATGKPPTFCCRKCRDKAYLKTQRMSGQRKRAAAGAIARPNGRKGTKSDWGDNAIRKAQALEKKLRQQRTEEGIRRKFAEEDERRKQCVLDRSTG